MWCMCNSDALDAQVDHAKMKNLGYVGKLGRDLAVMYQQLRKQA